MNWAATTDVNCVNKNIHSAAEDKDCAYDNNRTDDVNYCIAATNN